MLFLFGRETDRLPQRSDSILHHAAAIAIHDADRPSIGVILSRRHQILTILDKEERPAFERVIVYRMGISGEKLLDLRACGGIVRVFGDGPTSRPPISMSYA
jgi:hypothetical protein